MRLSSACSSALWCSIWLLMVCWLMLVLLRFSLMFELIVIIEVGVWLVVFVE